MVARGVSADAHDALDSLSKQTMFSGVSCILEVDIRKFFDTLEHAHLRSFLQQRVRDGVVLRLIGKWLNAGVMEDGTVTHPDSGSPQGGVISPVLANVYLHYVLDEWFASQVRPRLKGRAYVVRYADDFVIGFTDDEDARRVMAVLPKRFGKYGLTIHPDKTRLVPGPPPRPDCRTTPDALPEIARALGLLRDHGQQPGVGPFSPRGAQDLAQVARAATAGVAGLLELVSPALGSLPPALPACDPLRVPSRSKWITRGTECVNRARLIYERVVLLVLYTV
jgi:hypothetical protein